MLTNESFAVSDSLRFWRDTLGFPVTWEGESPASSTHTITGAPVGTVLKAAWLALPQTPHVGGSDQPNHVSTLELIEYELPADVAEEQKSLTPQARSWDVGAVHICLIVQGLDDILGKAKAQGYNVYGGVFTVPQESPVASGHRICYLRGPDGELVELTEIPK